MHSKHAALWGLCLALLTTPTHAKSHPPTGGQRAAITSAVRAYAAQGGMMHVKVERILVDGSYARAAVVPEAHVDTATVYLKHPGAAWKVITLGTGFAPGDLRHLGIPKSLW